MIRRHRSAVLIAVVTAAAFVAPTAEGARIVAVGDVHGNYDGLTAILREAKILDADDHWAGGDASYIQMGDVFDRGLEVTGVLDLLMRLQREAAAAGGRVEMILGNHEAMNLVGFYRDANPGIFATFADQRSEKRQKKLWSAVKRYRSLVDKPVDDAAEAEWLAEHPPGWVEYVVSLEPDGTYGKWLRERPVAVMLGGVLFIHGGISPEFANQTVASINAGARSELDAYDRVRHYLVAKSIVPPTAGVEQVGLAVQAILFEADKPDSTDLIRRHADQVRELADIDRWFLLSPAGPLWFRGASTWDEAEHGAEMAALLDGIGAGVMVVGHTPDPDGRIRVRFDGRVVLIDTGILSSYYEGGRPSALEIDGGVFTAIYLDGREVLPVAEGLDRAAVLIQPAGAATGEPAAAR